jgi:hypothetical protein
MGHLRGGEVVVTREDMIEQSITDHIRAGLVAKGYGPTLVKLRESFPDYNERATELTVTTVAIGFNFDDGGRNAELGSDLIRRIYTIELWVFGVRADLGRNVAHVIRAIAEEDGGRIPLKDVSVAGQPVIDVLVLLDESGVKVERQIAADPQPWDSHVWTVSLRLEDYYSPSLTD